MKLHLTKLNLTQAVLAMALAVPALSMAQHDDRHDDHDRGEQLKHNEPQRRIAPPAHRPPMHDMHADERGAGPDHAFRRGGRLPADYRSRQYVVDDWRGHHLTAPPRGYHWVQTGADYVLVAVATGIIADILLNQ